MAPKQKHTYYAYNEGYDPGLLRLGNLTFDFANPRLNSPYFHREVLLVPVAVKATSDERQD